MSIVAISASGSPRYARESRRGRRLGSKFSDREALTLGRSRSQRRFAITCATREDVDALVTKAVTADGRPAIEPQDHGFMYGGAFYDPDGHHWEVVWMDPKAAP